MRLGQAHRRLTAGFAVVSALLVVIAGQLVRLQGFDRAGNAQKAAAQRVESEPLQALRGQIVDRFGVPLAYTANVQDITADPTMIPPDQRADYAAQLSVLLGVPAADLVRALASPGKGVVLARAVSPTVVTGVHQLGLIGVFTQTTTSREYPAQSTGGNIIGAVRSDGVGASGIEYAFNDVLAGTNGELTYAVDATGEANPSGLTTRVNAINGGTVALTIDEDLQYTVQQYLDSAVAESGAKDGQVAVLDARTGQVLALASSGCANPADPASAPADAPLNPAVQTVFEPGSVNKVVTFAAALDKGVITPQTRLVVPGDLAMGGVIVHDDWAHQPVTYTATGVLAQSSNVGTLLIAQQLGSKSWYDYERKFGVGAVTGVELPGESAGIFPSMSQWSDSSFANLPIGQGVAVTVLQLASMYQTIANDGVRVPPRVIKSITRSYGATTVTAQPSGVRVVSAKTAKTVRTMLESVTLDGGTGVRAAVPGYRIAGKTGTAQQPVSSGGQYSSSANWDTFAGIAPADDPRFVVAVMIDNPAHGLHGGDVAAPLFQEIAGYELRHAAVAPTGSTSKHVPLMVCSEQVVATYGRSVC